MSRDTAMAEAIRLKAHMTDYGVRSSIELQTGRPWAGDPWYSRKVAICNHHTAGASTGNTPSLGLCKHGRAGLPGPLDNGYGGRDHIYRIMCMGLANHPGAGGPITLAGIRIPKDSARISVWGTEWEHDGKTPWPLGMRQFIAAANAALLEWMHRPVSVSIEHSTWAPLRKIDRNGYTAATGQVEILKHRNDLRPPVTLAHKEPPMAWPATISIPSEKPYDALRRIDPRPELPAEDAARRSYAWIEEQHRLVKEMAALLKTVAAQLTTVDSRLAAIEARKP